LSIIFPSKSTHKNLELLLHTPEIIMGKCKEGKKAHHWYVSNMVKHLGWLGWAGEGVSSWTLEEQLKLIFHGDFVLFPATKQKLMHFGKD
jgi:hypothetical protein